MAASVSKALSPGSPAGHVCSCSGCYHLSHPRSLPLELEEEPQEDMFFLVLLLSIHFAPEIMSLSFDGSCGLAEFSAHCRGTGHVAHRQGFARECLPG